MPRQHRLFLATAAAFAALCGPGVEAATHVVNASGDAGDGLCDLAACTLRDAFLAAAADGDASIISIDNALAASTITLTQGELFTSGDQLTLLGNGVVIERDPSVPCMPDSSADPGEFRLIRAQGGALTLSDLTLQGGCADLLGTPAGGVAQIDGDLDLDRVVVANNFAVDRGGGVFFQDAANAHTLSISRSTMRGNRAFKGGGLYFTGKALLLSDSTISGNTTFSLGGGAAVYGGESSTATISNSTFSGNRGDDGGGGLFLAVDSTVRGATFVDNFSYSGRDLSAGYNTDSQVSGSIFASTGGCARTQFLTGSGNLATDTSCQTVATIVTSTALALGPLSDNGGPTATHLPAADSVAIDSAGECGRSNDQRGLTGAVDLNGNTVAECDAGAVERQLRVFANGFESETPE